MALSLIAKRLAKQPIGTMVELTYGDGTAHYEKITGVITNSDFTTSAEITTDTGEELLLDYSIVRSVQVTKSLESIMQELTAGTKIQFSYGPEEHTEPELSAEVLDNDGEANLELKLSDGKEIILSYSLIHSLLVKSPAKPAAAKPQPAPIPVPVPVTVSAPAPTPAPVQIGDACLPLYQRKPTDSLNANDYELKNLYDRLPKTDRQKLGSAYESFRYGVKVNDRDKMTNAANQARMVLFRENDAGYYWSSDAARFCGFLLRRAAGVYDGDVFLVGACFLEAAVCTYRQQDFVMAGAYALLALLEPEAAHIDDLLIMVATGITKAEDAACLRLLHRHLPKGFDQHLQTLIGEALSFKGVQPAAVQSVESALTLLDTLYTGTAIADEVECWVDDEPEPEQPEPEEVKPAQPAGPMLENGRIHRLQWAERKGTIRSDDGKSYPFKYQDITDPKLRKAIESCLSATLDGKVYWVKFEIIKGDARGIQPGISALERGRAAAQDLSCQERYLNGIRLCETTIGVEQTGNALLEIVRFATEHHKLTGQKEPLEKAMALYDANRDAFPVGWWGELPLERAYRHLGDNATALEHAEKLLSFTDYSNYHRVANLGRYIRLCAECHKQNPDSKLLQKMIKRADEWEKLYLAEFTADAAYTQEYAVVVRRRFGAYCQLDRLEKAKADYELLEKLNGLSTAVERQMTETAERLAPRPAAEPEPEYEVVLPPVRQQEQPDAYPDLAEEEEEPEEIVPYEDQDGWAALHQTKQSVVDYALNISGPDRIPAILAYLKAGSMLEPAIGPVYRMVALAANDPMEAPDYNVTALVDALAGSDSDYPDLTDCCMGAAFLRTSFLSGRGYDYSTQGLRDSIAVTKKLPSLGAAYDTLEQFRNEAGWAIDIYADYRNHGVMKLMEDMDTVARHADELYTKFVVTAPREGVRFARLLETKKIIFARDGYLATMLRRVMERDQQALEAEKENFVNTYLGGVSQFSVKRISESTIDSIMVEGWEQAGKNMQFKKANAILQGIRRNNLRSNISDVLSTICQWYQLSEQNAGLTWRTPEGEMSYQRLRPQLLEQLSQLQIDCHAQINQEPAAQSRTGLFLLAETARELSDRLDGSWKFDQQKYTFVDFLRGDRIMLNDDFMPELSSTFCALPEFNVLARIRKHVEGEKLTFQQRIDRIYGMEKTGNNYGAAEKILEYLQAVGEAETVTLPENAEQFVNQTKLQIDMRFRSFKETYALAMNYGQIMQSDAFCYTLEDTVRYWHAFCTGSKNYGFFTSILEQAESQIHASARQYEEQLDEQLDALIANNQQQFDAYPGYADAIREQIAQQNFIVAEDWMNRIRLGDVPQNVMQQPEALGYLDRFWVSYASTYNRVADSSRTLSGLLGRRDVHNKDTKRAQQLIDNWLGTGHPSNSTKITQLLNLLGWQNIQVSQYRFAPEPRAEMYYVSEEIHTAGMTAPLHPIAAFGSRVARDGMYVSCLYGVYDCDRLYEKIRALDVIDGNKVILLDYALGGTDRRALARKLKKKESGLRNVYMVIDRVLICHLSNYYNENLINRILMAIAMPFSYCQPYVVESSHTMPPEIFIGRKDELMKIEQADGVNLIYGGRQLGKSALFKKARSDMDGNQQRRAVLIDIKDFDCASAARKLSAELIDLGILPDAEVTEDWETLCRSIKQRLRRQDDPIRYLLVMLDEADTFIDDCANFGYKPLVALKDIQQSLPGQFKFVLAGLHNIVRFNREVALGKNSVITHLPSLKITPFRAPEAQELLTVPLSYLGFSLPSNVTVSQILATVNYFPGLIQLYCQKLIESIRASDYAGYDIKKTPPYVITDDHLRRVMADKDFVEQIREKFEITLRLDQDQGSCYYPLALLIGWMYSEEPSKSGYTAGDVLRHARDLTIHPLAELDEEKIDALLQELRDLNILRNVGNNTYLLASKNFRDLLGSVDEIVEKLSKVGVAAV